MASHIPFFLQIPAEQKLNGVCIKVQQLERTLVAKTERNILGFQQSLPDVLHHSNMSQRDGRVLLHSVMPWTRCHVTQYIVVRWDGCNLHVQVMELLRQWVLHDTQRNFLVQGHRGAAHAKIVSRHNHLAVCEQYSVGTFVLLLHCIWGFTVANLPLKTAHNAFFVVYIERPSQHIEIYGFSVKSRLFPQFSSLSLYSGSSTSFVVMSCSQYSQFEPLS